MHRLINSAASIEVSRALDAVQVNLNGYGNFDQYQETFSMATKTANLYRTNAYLLIKPHFEDITYNLQ